ncbi:MAG TPA: SDR family oxidoreductase [Acidimicrobiales bacterium]|jgi:NAD(P)-dependent dehydrogenase (short-subunit alcohol dehydrogenase family)|nr:SDR family oxidoreductase [Acidimicrobiales bacterium]
MTASPLFDIEGKRAVVTGGGSGIGTMIARGFVQAGARVIIASRKEPSLKEVADELSAIGECSYIVADLSTEEGCRSLGAAVAERWDALDVLVNNAGANWGAPLAEQDHASWQRVLSVNVEGVFHTTKFLLPLLQAAGTVDAPARVINIGSVDGIQVPGFETYAYSASKAAVHQMTRHLAKHLAPTITVNAIAPGPFQSRMMRATLEAAGDQMPKMMPLKRIGRDEDMAGAAIFLASEASSFMTGAIIPVDGGIVTTK